MRSTRWVDWRFTVVSMLVVLLLVLPFYQCYRTLAAYRVCPSLSSSKFHSIGLCGASAGAAVPSVLPHPGRLPCVPLPVILQDVQHCIHVYSSAFRGQWCSMYKKQPYCVTGPHPVLPLLHRYPRLTICSLNRENSTTDLPTSPCKTTYPN